MGDGLTEGAVEMNKAQMLLEYVRRPLKEESRRKLVPEVQEEKGGKSSGVDLSIEKRYMEIKALFCCEDGVLE